MKDENDNGELEHEENEKLKKFERKI